MFKLMTAPVWILPWAIARLFKARATVRQGQRQRRVRVVNMPTATAPRVTVRVTARAIPGTGPALPPPPDLL